MKFIITIPRSGGRDDTYACVNFMFMMEHETNDIIKDIFCIRYRIRIDTNFQKDKAGLIDHLLLCKIQDDSIKYLGPVGQKFTIDDKEVYLLVNENREKKYYYTLDFNFMDTCLIDGAMEEYEKMKRIKRSEMDFEMKNTLKKFNINTVINKMIKLYKMEVSNE